MKVFSLNGYFGWFTVANSGKPSFCSIQQPTVSTWIRSLITEGRQICRRKNNGLGSSDNDQKGGMASDKKNRQRKNTA